MANKILFGVLFGILLVGCAQFTEMSKARDTGRAYLLGRFDQQICELENFVAASPGLDYPTARMVQEVIPAKVDVGIELRTKYEAPQAKIRLYGKKVPMPYTKAGVEAWISTIDNNIAKLKSKLEDAIAEAQAAAEEARIKEEERIAKEKVAAAEARIKEEERIAKELAEFDDDLARFNERLAETYAGLLEMGIASVVYHPINLRARELDGVFKYCATEANPWQIGIEDGVEKERAISAWKDWRKDVSNLRNFENIQERISKEKAEADADREYVLRKLPEEVDRINALLADTYSKLKEIAEDDQYIIRRKMLSISYKYKAAQMLKELDIGKTLYGHPNMWYLERKKVLDEFITVPKLGSDSWTISLKPDWQENYGKLVFGKDSEWRCFIKEIVSSLYKGFQKRLESTQEFINNAKSTVAKINAKAEAAQKKLTEFPGDSKYTMLSARPNPPELMKNINSGVSREWLETYLDATRAYKVKEDNTALVAEIEDREVEFYFKENTLYRIKINLPTNISIEALKAKYTKDENVEVKFEKLGKPRFSISPFGLDESGVVPFSQTVMFSFQKEDGVQVEAWGSEFSGLVWINFSGLSGLNIALSDTNTQLKYFKLDKTSRADVVLDANGNVIKCNTLGEQVLSVLQERLRKEKEKYSGDISTITLTDWILEEYCEALRRVTEEEKERKEAAEKKQAEAKALDF